MAARPLSVFYVLIKPNSPTTPDGAQALARQLVNQKQTKSTADKEGKSWFADVFDSRTGSKTLIYSDEACDEYGIDKDKAIFWVTLPKEKNLVYVIKVT